MCPTDIPGIKLRKIQYTCILIYNYRTLHSLDTIIWDVLKKTSRDIWSHVSNKYSHMSRLQGQVCLNMCTQSNITRDVTWSCILTRGHKSSTLCHGNKLIWKLLWLILCPIEIIGIIYGKCITFTVCFKNIYICLFQKYK
jgi:hypothetical protein